MTKYNSYSNDQLDWELAENEELVKINVKLLEENAALKARVEELEVK